MKMKTVTIHYWDGEKQKIEVPEKARYLEILPTLGAIYWHDKRPRFDGLVVYSGGERTGITCLDGHFPKDDGIRDSILLKIEEV